MQTPVGKLYHAAVTPEQEANLLKALGTVEDAVTRQAAHNMQLKGRVDALEACVEARELDNAALVTLVGSLQRGDETHDELFEAHTIEIKALRELLELQGRRICRIHSRLEEERRAGLEPRTSGG